MYSNTMLKIIERSIESLIQTSLSDNTKGKLNALKTMDQAQANYVDTFFDSIDFIESETQYEPEKIGTLVSINTDNKMYNGLRSVFKLPFTAFVGCIKNSEEIDKAESTWMVDELKIIKTLEKSTGKCTFKSSVHAGAASISSSSLLDLVRKITRDKNLCILTSKIAEIRSNIKSKDTRYHIHNFRWTSASLEWSCWLRVFKDSGFKIASQLSFKDNNFISMTANTQDKTEFFNQVSEFIIDYGGLPTASISKTRKRQEE